MVPLVSVLDALGRRLAKRADDLALATLRAQRVDPHAREINVAYDLIRTARQFR